MKINNPIWKFNAKARNFNSNISILLRKFHESEIINNIDKLFYKKFILIVKYNLPYYLKVKIRDWWKYAFSFVVVVKESRGTFSNKTKITRLKLVKHFTIWKYFWIDNKLYFLYNPERRQLHVLKLRFIHCC